MGMFNWVNYKMNCPKCGSEVEGFQSKDGICRCSIVEPCEISNFYNSCKKCGAWIEFNRKPVTEEDILKTFNMTVNPAPENNPQDPQKPNEKEK